MKNIEAERSVLGSILVDPDSLLKASDILQINDFYLEKHRYLFAACHDAYQDCGQVDLVIVADRLRAKGELDSIGIDYLSALAADVPTSANIKYHAKIVKNASTVRRIFLWSQSLQTKIKSGVEDVRELLGSMEKDIVDLSTDIKEKKSPNVNDIFAILQKEWDDENAGIITYIPVDSKLYALVPQYRAGHLWIIGGFTSVGKTTFLAEQAEEASQAGAKVLIFSLEDSREEKLIKLIANVSGVSQKRLMINDFKGKEESIKNAAKTIAERGIKIYDDIKSVEDIRLKIKKHKLQDGVDIVFIDYIQNIRGEGKLYDRVSDAIKGLADIADEMAVTMIVLSQLSYEEKMKGSGDLAETADIAIWMTRNTDIKKDKTDPRNRYIDAEVRKNRPFGETGIVPLIFSENYSSISKRGM